MSKSFGLIAALCVAMFAAWVVAADAFTIVFPVVAVTTVVALFVSAVLAFDDEPSSRTRPDDSNWRHW